MLNYKQCHIDDFNEALKNKDMNLADISDEHLYILYTKFKADALTCFRSRTPYAAGLGAASEDCANAYKKELKNRGISVL